MTKVKLIDAEKFRNSILNVASSYSAPMPSSQPYYSTGLEGSLQNLNYEIQRMIQNAVTEGVRQALFSIAYQTDVMSTDDYGCILCRPGNDEVPPHPLKGHINETASDPDPGF